METRLELVFLTSSQVLHSTALQAHGNVKNGTIHTVSSVNKSYILFFLRFSLLWRPVKNRSIIAEKKSIYSSKDMKLKNVFSQNCIPTEGISPHSPPKRTFLCYFTILLLAARKKYPCLIFQDYSTPHILTKLLPSAGQLPSVTHSISNTQYSN